MGTNPLQDNAVEALVQSGFIERELVDKAAEHNASITIRVEVRWNQSEKENQPDKERIKSENSPRYRLESACAYKYSAEDFVSFANQGDVSALRFLQRIIQYGVTKKLVEEINSRLTRIRMRLQVQLSPDMKRVEKDYVWPDDITPTADEGLTLAMVEFIRADALEKLKECAAEDCENLHFRRGKWCSDRCGGRQRIRKKRKLDKERQML